MNMYQFIKSFVILFSLSLALPVKTNVIWFPPTPWEVAQAQNNVIWTQAAAEQSIISWLFLAQEMHEQRLKQQKVNEYLAQLRTLAFTPGRITGVAVLDLSILEYEEECKQKNNKKPEGKHGKKKKRR